MDGIKVKLPELHSGQITIIENAGKHNVVCCGRRFGKTTLMVAIAGTDAASGAHVGLFTPEYKQLAEPWEMLKDALKDMTIRSSKNDGVIRLKGGGVIDFWTLNDNELAGRGREYDVVCIDEAAYTKAKDMQMINIWEKGIKPTLLTTDGESWLFSTPNGIDQDNFFFRAWHDPDWKFIQHHAPTANNPYVSPALLEEERLNAHPLVWKQEFLADFVSWDNDTFFKLHYFMDDNKMPVDYPNKCDLVFAVMDCAVKAGTENDATAIVYFAYNQLYGTPLTILDYELHSIEAASLEYLGPDVLKKCQRLAEECGARLGTIGCFVEDAAGGSILLQWAKARGWMFRAIDSVLMSKGKDERAMIAGGPAHLGQCKFSHYAHDKLVQWKGRTMNHLLHQILTFRVGDKDAAKRADDALDCFTYGIANALTEHKAL